VAEVAAMRPRQLAIGIGLAVVILGCGRVDKSESATLSVSVAASLQNAMVELAPAYEQSHPGIKLTFNFGGSARGAADRARRSGDVFLSAAPKP